VTSGAAFAAVDWGTSSLRVWLLDEAGKVLAERRSDEGMLVARETGFAAILERMLGELGASSTLPVIICGMAGARQGWVEAPYQDVPAKVDTVLTGAIRVSGMARDIRIVPGLAQREHDAPDVMRGEETQLVGAAERLPAGQNIVCLPGTHSKWVEVDQGTIGRFRTFLTGELFAVLSANSILKHSLDGAGSVDPASNPAFDAGVERGLAARTLGSLFSIRAGGLLFDRKPDESAATLSGLLIGGEIAAADRLFGLSRRVVTLVAAGRLADLYERALELAGHGAHLIDADEAVRAGLFAAAKRVWGAR
jgi:2-dehydro-3-deoxygalactonokinase